MGKFTKNNKKMLVILLFIISLVSSLKLNIKEKSQTNNSLGKLNNLNTSSYTTLSNLKTKESEKLKALLDSKLFRELQENEMKKANALAEIIF